MVGGLIVDADKMFEAIGIAQEHPIARAFEAMEIAEDELDRSDAERGLFMFLQPPAVLMAYATFPVFYRHHVRELRERWSEAPDEARCLPPARRAKVMAKATYAELLAVLSVRTHDAMLQHEDVRIMQFAFTHVFGETLGLREPHLSGYDHQRVNDLRWELRNRDREAIRP
jgi:hypothetical protein